MAGRDGCRAVGTVSKGFLSKLETRREQIRHACEGMLLEARAAGREHLNAGEAARYEHAKRDLDGLDEHIAEVRDGLARSGLPAGLRGEGREVSSAGRLAPLGYQDEQLKRAFEQIGRGETAVMEARDYSPLVGLVPPELGPILPIFPRHETRLLNKLPGIAIDVPAIAYIEVAATTGAAGVVLEGSPKPELVMPATQQTATARKIAGHTAVSWEAYSGDYLAFVSAVQVELMKSIVDAENQQLFAGTGEANGQVNGLTTNANVLTFDASGVTTTPGPWDALEHGIELLRSGPALAEPDLCLMNPTTWSAVRRVTNSLGDYYVAADPSSDEVDQAWGIPVLTSTKFTAGTAVLVDTTQYGRVVVRESLVTRIGFAGTDFTDNIVRFVSEERLTQTIERPQAICVISSLPTAAPTETTARTTTKK